MYPDRVERISRLYSVDLQAEQVSRALSMLLAMYGVLVSRDKIETILKDLRVGNLIQIVQALTDEVYIAQFIRGECLVLEVEKAGKDMVITLRDNGVVELMGDVEVLYLQAMLNPNKFDLVEVPAEQMV